PEPGVWPEGSYGRVAPIQPPPDQVRAAAELLVNAELPVIHAGSGTAHAGAFEEVRAGAELLHARVVTSWGGRGVLAENHHLAVPMIYVKLNNEIRCSGDVVLTLGSRVGETDWWGKAPYWRKPAEQKMIQVDTDEAILGANKPVAVPILADVRVFLQELLRELKSRPDVGAGDRRRKKADALLAKKVRFRTELDKHLRDAAAPIHSAHVAVITQKLAAEDSILVVDG